MERKVKDNHPVKGSIISVYPIRRTEDIDSIKKLLSNHPRDLLLFVLGTNNGLRVSDLLPLKVKDLKNLKPGEYLKIREKKTSGIRHDDIIFSLQSMCQGSPAGSIGS